MPLPPSFQESDFQPPSTFGGLEEEWCDWDRSRYVLIPVPYEATSSYLPGSGRGPEALLAASRFLELYDEETGRELYRARIHTLPPLVQHRSSPQQMLDAVQRAVEAVLDADKFPIVLGGEHTISVGAVKAVVSRLDNVSVLALDAHADLRNEYEGTSWSHACTLRRIIDVLPPSNLVLVGTRSLSQEEHALIESEGIRVLWAQESLQGSPALPPVKGPVYLSIDVDVFDPAFMPAVGTPEPGGLSWYQVLEVVKQAFQRWQVVGCDVVELAPRGGEVAGSFLAAKLVYKIMAYEQAFGRASDGD